jgi:hypothetical protein
MISCVFIIEVKNIQDNCHYYRFIQDCLFHAALNNVNVAFW